MAKQDKRAKAVKAEKKKWNGDVNINSKHVKKATKKVGFIPLFFAAVFILVGVGLGFVATQRLCANDCFEMIKYENNEIDVSIGLEGDCLNYTELGAKCVSFGKKFDVNIEYFYREDISHDEVKVDSVDSTKEGVYYAVYTTSSKKYSSVKLIRTIYVFGEEDNG